MVDDLLSVYCRPSTRIPYHVYKYTVSRLSVYGSQSTRMLYPIHKYAVFRLPVYGQPSAGTRSRMLWTVNMYLVTHAPVYDLLSASIRSHGYRFYCLPSIWLAVPRLLLVYGVPSFIISPVYKYIASCQPVNDHMSTGVACRMRSTVNMFSVSHVHAPVFGLQSKDIQCRGNRCAVYRLSVYELPSRRIRSPLYRYTVYPSTCISSPISKYMVSRPPVSGLEFGLQYR